MSRSLWKGPYVSQKSIQNKSEVFLVARNLEIVPAFLGLTFKVYNGKRYTNLTVTNDMIGYKFGEFSFTRTNFVFKKKAQKK